MLPLYTDEIHQVTKVAATKVAAKRSLQVDIYIVGPTASSWEAVNPRFRD